MQDCWESQAPPYEPSGLRRAVMVLWCVMVADGLEPSGGVALARALLRPQAHSHSTAYGPVCSFGSSPPIQLHAPQTARSISPRTKRAHCDEANISLRHSH